MSTDQPFEDLLASLPADPTMISLLEPLVMPPDHTQPIQHAGMAPGLLHQQLPESPAAVQTYSPPSSLPETGVQLAEVDDHIQNDTDGHLPDSAQYEHQLAPGSTRQQLLGEVTDSSRNSISSQGQSVKHDAIQQSASGQHSAARLSPVSEDADLLQDPGGLTQLGHPEQLLVPQTVHDCGTRPAQKPLHGQVLAYQDRGSCVNQNPTSVIGYSQQHAVGVPASISVRQQHQPQAPVLSNKAVPSNHQSAPPMPARISGVQPAAKGAHAAMLMPEELPQGGGAVHPQPKPQQVPGSSSGLMPGFGQAPHQACESGQHECWQSASAFDQPDSSLADGPQHEVVRKQDAVSEEQQQQHCQGQRHIQKAAAQRQLLHQGQQQQLPQSKPQQQQASHDVTQLGWLPQQQGQQWSSPSQHLPQMQQRPLRPNEQRPSEKTWTQQLQDVPAVTGPGHFTHELRHDQPQEQRQQAQELQQQQPNQPTPLPLKVSSGLPRPASSQLQFTQSDLLASLSQLQSKVGLRGALGAVRVEDQGQSQPSQSEAALLDSMMSIIYRQG